MVIVVIPPGFVFNPTLNVVSFGIEDISNIPLNPLSSVPDVLFELLTL